MKLYGLFYYYYNMDEIKILACGSDSKTQLRLRYREERYNQHELLAKHEEEHSRLEKESRSHYVIEEIEII